MKAGQPYRPYRFVLTYLYMRGARRMLRWLKLIFGEQAAKAIVLDRRDSAPLPPSGSPAGSR